MRLFVFLFGKVESRWALENTESEAGQYGEYMLELSNRATTSHIITAAEQQTMNYYMNIGQFYKKG